MEPIVPLNHKVKSQKAEDDNTLSIPSLTLFDKITFVCASLIVLITFGLSAYFTFGFSQTDLGILTLLSSAALSFGIGALVYLPASFIVWVIRQKQKGQEKRLFYALIILTSIPWIIISVIFLTQSAVPKPYGSLALSLSVWLTIWASIKLIRLQKSHRQSVALKKRPF